MANKVLYQGSNLNMQNEFYLPLRVYIEDTDAGGIVYYVNYLKYMERARTELLRSKGFSKPAILDEGMLLVVVASEVLYKKPARLDDELEVTAKIIELARSYAVFEQHIFCDEVCLTESKIKIACVNRGTMRPCAFPRRVAQLMKPS